MKKCIFITVFYQEQYFLEMFNLLLESIYLYGTLGDDIEVLVYTSTKFKEKIKKSKLFSERIVFEINDTYKSIGKACLARLDLFSLKSINNYDQILYLDTDIIVKGDLHKVFSLIEKDLLYVLEECLITDGEHGGYDKKTKAKSLFTTQELNDITDKIAFTSGIMLFNNCSKINQLFAQTKQHITSNNNVHFTCWDQPYIVYNAFKLNIVSKSLGTLVVNYDSNVLSNKVIHHFPGITGNYINKLEIMSKFLADLALSFPTQAQLILKDEHGPPIKNEVFPLVAYCVSYDYMDTLCYMLPVNHQHFDHIYIVTQTDDLNTINFCKNYANVTVLFHNFKNNGKEFDKFGAINYAQHIMYEAYPDHWYLGIDSDILLPNNFIDILVAENLDPNCLYGAIRNNLERSSELRDKNQVVLQKKNLNWVCNDILNKKTITKPSIIGCFQLHKKKCFVKTNYSNAGFGDYEFGYENFQLFCHLQNLMYLHLGPAGKNWKGVTQRFIHDDKKLTISDIYFNCNINCKNIYYDLNCNEVKNYTSTGTDNDNVTIYDDVWTCSEKMRTDIAEFFGVNGKKLRIAEIGAHKGFSTKVLANIFHEVFAVDNNVEWTKFNKLYNHNLTNITYVDLDIYKNSWKSLPENIDVTFIDACHEYETCKSDITNSLAQFKTLEYIVFDDYGVWPGVNKSVDEAIAQGQLIFEKFIGLNHVPGPTSIIKYVNEGIICRVNKYSLGVNNPLRIPSVTQQKSVDPRKASAARKKSVDQKKASAARKKSIDPRKASASSARKYKRKASAPPSVPIKKSIDQKNTNISVSTIIKHTTS